MCAHVGVDTESHMSHLALGSSQFVDNLQLGNRLHVEAEDSIIKCQINFPVGLAHSGKHDFIGRESGFDCRTNFSAAHTIGSHATFTNDGEHFGIGVGLYRIVDVEVRVTL
ncbi:hypothetical protein SDC9_158000 [bioreactor metagenome]|uniref:Uncharacterized protein n=1 Tax=bioreactor metagenome TaxID=1076179 RepID=A0A645FE87_9ZZZZ